MYNKESFGEIFKRKRLEQKLTLRKFCLKYGLDPGNISKVERGRLSPPQDTSKLEDYAKWLGIKKNSDDWNRFMDLAAAGAGIIPKDILSDEELLEQMPLVFRFIREQDFSEDKLNKLIEKIRKAQLDHKISVPYLSEATIIEAAELFLEKFNPKVIFPLEIEEIVEFDLGLDIIPILNLEHVFIIKTYMCVQNKIMKMSRKTSFSSLI